MKSVADYPSEQIAARNVCHMDRSTRMGPTNCLRETMNCLTAIVIWEARISSDDSVDSREHVSAVDPQTERPVDSIHRISDDL